MIGPLPVALGALAIVALLAGRAGGPTLAAAALLGGFAGFALRHAGFGFTSAWRRMARERRGAGLRAQMLLVAATGAVSYPLIAAGAANGFVAPMGLASAFGAFVFGIGMQLGGGCGSGTLYALGGGSTRMAVTLSAFVAGSFLATAHWEFWRNGLAGVELNGGRGVSLIDELGAAGALVLLLGFCALVALGSAALERRAHGALEPPAPQGSWLRGPWSLAGGALALAAVGVGSLLLLGHPWGITSAFALWGAKLWGAAGGGFDGMGYWGDGGAGSLSASVFADGISVMNFGIMAGAMAATALAGRWAPNLRLSARDIGTAVIGGLMMGYGARLAFGCNIGAYLGGLVSGSLHGLWWLAFAWPGSLAGVRLRALLAMDPPLEPRPT